MFTWGRKVKWCFFIHSVLNIHTHLFFLLSKELKINESVCSSYMFFVVREYAVAQIGSEQRTWFVYWLCISITAFHN